MTKGKPNQPKPKAEKSKEEEPTLLELWAKFRKELEKDGKLHLIQ